MVQDKIMNTDDSINGVSNIRLVDSCSAGDKVRHPRLSSSETFTTKADKRKLPLRVACWNVKTMLRARKLENIKQEMIRLTISIVCISHLKINTSDRHRRHGCYYLLQL